MYVLYKENKALNFAVHYTMNIITVSIAVIAIYSNAVE